MKLAKRSDTLPCEARECIGGPLHGEIVVFWSSSICVSFPADKNERTNPDKPEWFAYRAKGDDMMFVGRFDNPCGHFAELEQ